MSMKKLMMMLTLVIFGLTFVSAGVGIKWNSESAFVPENTNTCLTYNVYNPWNDDVYAQVELSDELINITKKQSSDIKFIPGGTSSSDAIPVEFCFKTPRVYDRDCLIAGVLICEQACQEEMKVYEGKVNVIELTEAQVMGGGGSATKMSVSAPLRIRVQCVAHDRNWSVVYIVIILITGAFLAFRLFSKKKKSRKKN